MSTPCLAGKPSNSTFQPMHFTNQAAQACIASRRTQYTHAAGQLPVMMKNWEVALETRLKFGPITALWYTDLGGLNKWIHVWPYKSLDQRNEVRDQAHKTGAWPPSARAKTDGRPIENLVAQENKFMTAASFSPIK